MSLRKVNLYRDGFETPWGFRLQGGKDLSRPLTIQRVFTNSPAEGELQRGDIIVSINGRESGSFTHKQALDHIKFGGGQIDLVIERPPSGRVNIKPLAPQSPTRAPSLPSPTKTPLFPPSLFPSRAQPAGPPSPTKRDMPHPQGAGFTPKKITMNKYGGGGYSFGTDFVHSPRSPPVHNPAVRSSGKKIIFNQSSQQTPSFGTDFTKPRPFTAQSMQQTPIYAPPPVPSKPQPQAPPVQSAVQIAVHQQQKRKPARDQVDSRAAWTSTLRAEAQDLKPWERDQIHQETFDHREAHGFQPTFDETDASPSYQSRQPMQIKTKSTTRHRPVPAPHHQQQQQYQQQQQAPVQSSAPATKPLPGERDWNESYVYRMLHEEKTTERQSHPGGGHTPTQQTEVRTRDTYETARPGEEPKRTVKETYSTSAFPPRLDEALGMSDF